MTITVDASSPAVVTQTSGTTSPLTSATFTPPPGSVVAVLWAGNSTSLPAQPTTSGLTLNLVAWRSRNDGSPAVDGQAAIWWGLGAGSAISITVNNLANSGFRHSALGIKVLNGVDTASPIGASGKAGSASASAISQAYTAQATGGWGFMTAADWDALAAMTATNANTTMDSSGTPGGQFTYGLGRRTNPDDVNGVSNSVQFTMGGTSTALAWVWAEFKPAATAGSLLIPRRPRIGALMQM